MNHWLEQQSVHSFERSDSGEGEFVSDDEVNNRMTDLRMRATQGDCDNNYSLGESVLTDRENIFIYPNKASGAMVSIAADDRFIGMIEILKDKPLAGVKADRTEISES